MPASAAFRTSIGVCIGLCLVKAQADKTFHVSLYEDVPPAEAAALSPAGRRPSVEWNTPVLGVLEVPGKISPDGLTMRRERPFLTVIEGKIEAAGGEYEIQLRSRNRARLAIDGSAALSSEPPAARPLTAQEVAAQQAEENKQKEEAAKAEARRQLQDQVSSKRLEDPSLEFNESVLKAVQEELTRNKRTLGLEKSDTEPPKPLQTTTRKFTLTGGAHNVRLEFLAETSALEVSVSWRKAGEPMYLMGFGPAIRFSEKGWSQWEEIEKKHIDRVTEAARLPLRQNADERWRSHHEGLRLQARKPSLTIDAFVDVKLTGAHVQPASLAADAEFVRRIYLDVWGLIPTAEQATEFLEDRNPDKRTKLIGNLLADKRWADQWVAYWQDVLAENPKTFGKVANSTGPFKHWIFRTFAEDSGYDRFASELILMEGTDREEGTLGFAESLENDVPMAEKAFVLSQAFMAANMKCARCHDSPINRFQQRDLFGLAAMLNGKPVSIPASSSVGFIPGRRPPAVRVTTKPGELIAASFVFEPGKQLEAQSSSRQVRMQLAAWLTSQRRFAQTGVNRIWKRFLGTGLVEPVDDWPAQPKVSHPELLEFLTDEFIGSGFSVRHIERLILESKAYQRSRNEELASARDAQGLPLFAGQPPRRMRAEEVVDSLHSAVRRKFRTERMAYGPVDYGYPQRLWQVVTLSNEEDNAILARPLLQEVITLGSTFGWRDQRPDPVSERNSEPNALQPLSLANGGLITRLTRLTDFSYYTKLLLTGISLKDFEDQLFLNALSRQPNDAERRWLERKLGPLWASRRVNADAAQVAAAAEKPIPMVRDMLDAYRYLAEARQAEPATVQLNQTFRENVESVLWVLFNSPEFLFVP